MRPEGPEVNSGHQPKNGLVTCFTNSLQNKEFRELLVGRPGREAGIGCASSSRAEGAAQQT